MKRKSFKLGLVSILAAGALFQIPNLAAASNVTKAEVLNTLNFRTAPSTTGTIIKSLKKVTTATLVSKVNSYWYKVNLDGKIGYVSSSAKYIIQ